MLSRLSIILFTSFDNCRDIYFRTFSCRRNVMEREESTRFTFGLQLLYFRLSCGWGAYYISRRAAAPSPQETKHRHSKKKKKSVIAIENEAPGK